MFKKKCDFCPKEIEGFTEKQVNYLMLQHIVAKHKEKIKLEGVKG
jgi:hypothetical protein